MISKDESIITQVVAKIASELTGVTQTDGTSESIQATYLSHFDFVREVVFGAHNIQSNMTTATTNANAITEAEIIQTFNATPVSSGNGGIQIVGAQHGPIPSWLVEQCARNGVTKVFDNRDTANAENRRPLFKAADGKTNAKGQPLAFWPPSKR